MSDKIIITSDSTTDLSPELLSRYNIRILPLGVSLDGKHYTDGVDITPDVIYSNYRKNGTLPKTSAPNISDTTDFFRNLTADHCKIVHFTISSEMSSSFANARLAAEELGNIEVVDTRNLSTGGGLLVLHAAELAAKGDMSIREIAEACRKRCDLVDASFIIDNLEFLYKGGRCSALEMLGANMLRIKPCIVVKDGKMSVGHKYRGKFERVLPNYISDRLSQDSRIDPRRVFITHAGCDAEVVSAAAEQVKRCGIFKEVLVTRAGCTISSHCGQNTLGVLFLRNA